MQRWVVVCFLPVLLSAVFADECPNGGHCKDGQTCCQHPGKGYECCPFDKAECCGDHVHCCPARMSCDVEKSRCVNATLSVPWAERTPTEQPSLSRSFRMIKSYIGEDDDNICPDQSRCPAEFSCLRSLTKYGCCPLAQGIPCSDGKHCCPQGHSCSEDSRSCVKKDVTSTVLCSDGVSECPDESSCCEGPDGQFGCCPMPQAVCCDDNVHCCPEGSLCDLETSKCVSVSSKKQLPMWAKFPARRRAEWEDQKEERHVTSEAAAGTENEEGKAESLETKTVNAVLPGEHAGYIPCDKFTYCADGYTCCTNLQSQWVCCVLPNAVCCNDHTYCCPQHATCNLVYKTCVSGNTSTPMSRNIPAITIAAPSATAKIQVTEPALNRVVSPGERASDVPCNDTVACPDDTTCCTTKEGDWACCDSPNAVCCSDHEHCCPHGTTCDLVHDTCVDSLTSLMTPMSRKTPAITTAAPPAPAKIQVTEPALNSVVSPGERASDVPCNETVACPDDTTCCTTKEGDWACCDSPNAVCCSDHEHCCPHGTTCDLVHDTCVDSLTSLLTPMSRKTPAITTTAAPPAPTKIQVTEPALNSVVSPGERASDVPCNETVACPDDTTCCTTKEGDWACCDSPNAVCCSDHEHCCPHGTTCDLVHDTCVDSNSLMTPMSRKTPAITTAAPPAPAKIQVTEPALNSVVSPGERASDVPCNDTVACPDDTTCCTTKEGDWACCDSPNAVCCSDHEHCCPHGTTCDLVHDTCVDSLTSLLTPMSRKTPAITTAAATQRVTGLAQSEQTESEEDEGGEDGEDEEDVEDRVQCKSHKKSACPRNSTCCRSGCRKRRCCPMPHGTCCRDGKHCCPHGYKCCHRKQSCVKDEVEIPWYTKTPALSIPKQQLSVERQVSEPQPTEQTESEEDEEEDGDDEDDDDDVDEEIEHVHCRKNSTCPTCCGKKTHKFCCQHSNATCCHGNHCCPHGYKCCHRKRACVKDEVVIPWYTSVPVLSIPEPQPTVASQVPEPRPTEQTESEEDEAEDGDDDDDDDDDDIEHGKHCKSHKNSTCPTCCGKERKKYCCPYPKATCCSDGKHCCPHKHWCHPPKQGCVKDGVVIPWYTAVEALPTPEPVNVETPENEPSPPKPVWAWFEDEMREAEDDDVYEDDEDEAEDDLVHCDRKHTCPKGTTCCNSGNGWGCCPLPHAVCCSDGKHCCPHRYKCSKFRGACVRDDNVVIPWYTKLPALSDPDSEKDVKCSDGRRCPEYHTCCQLSSGEYGCCPMENAMCCNDRKHCCPAGFGCDLSTGQCERAVVLELEFVPLTPAVSEPFEESGVICGRETCPDDNKCCRNRGMFYCCPYKTGMCCNTRYCCPPGQSCSEDGKCTSNSGSLWENWPFFYKRDEENPLIL